MCNIQPNPDTDYQELCRMVETLVEQFIPTMVPGHRYTLETICGNAFWDRLTPDQLRDAGEYMSLLVSSGEFDLDYGETGGKATKQYQLK